MKWHRLDFLLTIFFLIKVKDTILLEVNRRKLSLILLIKKKLHNEIPNKDIVYVECNTYIYR